MNLPEIIYQGSVKNLRGNSTDDFLFFEFSDHYSVFDWGKMPDQLTDKGKALSYMGAMIFEFLGDKSTWLNWNLPALLSSEASLIDALENLRQNGMNSHFLKQENNLLKVEKVDVIHPEWNGENWDYNAYTKNQVNCLVPLEIIFRHGVPEGSSLMRRLKNDPEYGKQLGIVDEVNVGHRFLHPLIEFSTKLEPRDRFLSYREAQNISGMSDLELSHLKGLSILLSLRLKDLFHKTGIELWDGKFEFAFSNCGLARGFKLVDSIGPDELRLVSKGIHLSKESLRQFYVKTPWYQSLVRAKNKAIKENSKAWKKYCEISPPRLPDELKEMVENIYRVVTNKVAITLGHPEVFNISVDFENYRKSLGTSE